MTDTFVGRNSDARSQGRMMRTGFWTAALIAALALPSFAADARDKAPAAFTVGTAIAAPAQKAFGDLNIPAGEDAALTIPVAVINGARPGPVLAITTGAHGTEYASIIAVTRLIQQIDPEVLRGTLVVLPLINVTSFEKKIAHINPIDGRSMNSAFPGRLDGTQTQRASAIITREVIERVDHVIDLHGGDLDEDLRPYAYWNKSGNEAVDRKSLDMVLAFGLNTIVINTGASKDPANSRTLENTATLHGKSSMVAEAGHAGIVEAEDVARLVDGSLSVMRHLGMLPGSANRVEAPVWISNASIVKAPISGMFQALQAPGAYVASNAIIGRMTDHFGSFLGDVRAPDAGILLFIRSVPSMVKDDAIASVGKIADAAEIPSFSAQPPSTSRPNQR